MRRPSKDRGGTELIQFVPSHAMEDIPAGERSFIKSGETYFSAVRGPLLFAARVVEQGAGGAPEQLQPGMFGAMMTPRVVEVATGSAVLGTLFPGVKVFDSQPVQTQLGLTIGASGTDWQVLLAPTAVAMFRTVEARPTDLRKALDQMAQQGGLGGFGEGAMGW